MQNTAHLGITSDILFEARTELHSTRQFGCAWEFGSFQFPRVWGRTRPQWEHERLSNQLFVSRGGSQELVDAGLVDIQAGLQGEGMRVRLSIEAWPQSRWWEDGGSNVRPTQGDV